MKDINFKNELITARDAAKAAGKILINNRNTLNKLIFSSEKDVKLEADLAAENLIKEIIKNRSCFPILAEESGKSIPSYKSQYFLGATNGKWGLKKPTPRKKGCS